MKIFVCEDIHPEARALLAGAAQLVDTPEQLAQADGLLTRNFPVDAALLAQCPRLRAVAVHGTGTDGVDLRAAAEHGVRVVYAPGENAASVAEMIAALTLALAKKVCEADRALHGSANVPCAPSFLRGTELAGKTLGLVGVGDIARRAGAIFAGGFGMRVVGWSPSLTVARAAQLGMERCAGVREVFERADVVSIGVPLCADTVGLVGEAELAAARPGALLINTARGRVVDEAALYSALVHGPLGGAACDVFASEPPTRANPLLSLPNFIATPHIAASTQEALRRTGLCAAQGLLDVLEGRTPQHELRAER